MPAVIVTLIAVISAGICTLIAAASAGIAVEAASAGITVEATTAGIAVEAATAGIAVEAATAGIAVAAPLPQGSPHDQMRERLAGRAFQEAEQLIRSWLKDHPDDAEAWQLLGQARQGRWDFEGAADAYREALDLGRENAELLRGWVETKGRSSGNVSLFFTAGSLRRDLERALELDPTHVESRAFLAAFYYMVPRILGGDKEKADRLIEELIEMSPADGYYILGARAREEKEPMSVAVDYWERALEIDPGHVLTLTELGRYWLRQEEYERALTLFERAVASAPDDPLVLTSYGRALRRSGRLDESADQYRRALEVDPFWADARLALAEYFERIEEPDSALHEYLVLTRNNPTFRSREIQKRIMQLRH
jgi:tetratricopeptide (TPR) repeat protein